MIKKVKKQDINQSAKKFVDYCIERLVSKIESNNHINQVVANERNEIHIPDRVSTEKYRCGITYLDKEGHVVSECCPYGMTVNEWKQTPEMQAKLAHLEIPAQTDVDAGPLTIEDLELRIKIYTEGLSNNRLSDKLRDNLRITIPILQDRMTNLQKLLSS